MRYINSNHLKEIGVDWKKTINIIEGAVNSLDSNNYSQPIKPYLKFSNPKNRIIAMPAYISGDSESCGIKWISSFPDNINNNIPRAHSATILNDTQTGKPIAIINSAIISAIRTASVSGLIIEKFLNHKKLTKIKLGILGFGPIGQLHLQMVKTILGDRLQQVNIYDLKGVNRDLISDTSLLDKVNIVDSYEEAYDDADIFITCTVSNTGYIEREPKFGNLILNVSLRDFKSDFLNYNPLIIVDNWDEVCRENTDIERMSIDRGLKKEQTYSICDVIIREIIKDIPDSQSIMFNPMGMAVFDIAMAQFYFNESINKDVGIELED